MNIWTSYIWKFHTSSFLLCENSHVHWRWRTMNIQIPFLSFSSLFPFSVHFQLGESDGDSLEWRWAKPERPNQTSSRLHYPQLTESDVLLQQRSSSKAVAQAGGICALGASKGQWKQSVSPLKTKQRKMVSMKVIPFVLFLGFTRVGKKSIAVTGFRTPYPKIWQIEYFEYFKLKEFDKWLV